MAKLRRVLGYGKKILKRQIGFRLGRLTGASLELTYRCNLRCEMCSLWEAPEDKAEALTKDDWLRVVDELADMGCKQVGLAGGEPSLVPGFLEIVERIKARNMTASITTNGLSTGRYTADFARLFDDIYISVDATDELHDKIRRFPGALKATTRNLRKLVDYKRENGLTRPTIHMHATIIKSNVGAINDLIAYGDEIGVDVVSFQYVSVSPQSAVDRSTIDGQCVASDRFTFPNADELLLDDVGVRQFREQVASLHPTKKALVVLEPTKSLSDRALKTGVFPVKRCTVMLNQIAVRPNGETTICAYITGYSMGSVKAESIREIWYGEPRRKLVRLLSTRLLPVCRNCCAFSCSLTPGQLLRIALGRRI